LEAIAYTTSSIIAQPNSMESFIGDMPFQTSEMVQELGIINNLQQINLNFFQQ
jgi:hypothetical protein